MPKPLPAKVKLSELIMLIYILLIINILYHKKQTLERKTWRKNKIKSCAIEKMCIFAVRKKRESVSNLKISRNVRNS